MFEHSICLPLPRHNSRQHIGRKDVITHTLNLLTFKCRVKNFAVKVTRCCQLLRRVNNIHRPFLKFDRINPNVCRHLD
ncbi:MAG: hypothetical protein BWY72_02522 [Bacteroidetes bacterium ADurb.Bin416]|nr:MAG: hypothetical protein BWY72_02522 [Bacteroidetes bacterium ADurb.Bin416]